MCRGVQGAGFWGQFIEDPLGGSTAAPRFWSSGDLRSAGKLAALRFEDGCSLGVVGNVLVLGFALGKISAILGKISAILGLGRLASILRRPVVDLGAVWAVLGRLGAVLGTTWATSWGQVAVLGASWGSLGPSWAHLGRILAPS